MTGRDRGFPSPADLARSAERWFRQNKRPLPWRTTYDAYEVWVSEVMAQQTRMEVVCDYFPRFLARFPDLAALAAASENDVLAAWSGLGYYRRARMLHAGARFVVDRLGGVVPRDVETLLTIPGVGRYTAGAIASIAWNEPAPLVDGNVTRVLARLRGFAEPVGSGALERELWTAARELVEAAESPRDFNQSLMELGSMICTPASPRCLLCPLAEGCVARAEGLTGELPVRRAPGATRQLAIPLYVVTDRRGHVLMRREEGKLMSGMLHLPHGNSELLPADGTRFEVRELLGAFRHTVTNRRIEFTVTRAELPARVRDGGGEYVWVDPAELHAVAHPAYVKKALKIAFDTKQKPESRKQKKPPR